MPAPNKSKRRVLVVDDSLDTAQTLAFLLKDAGHEVEYAINGRAALEIAVRQRPQIVFVDIGLPDYDGVDLARDLRRLPGLGEARVVAVTGRASEDEARALAAGCHRFLRKPVDPAHLERLIHDELA